MIRAYVQKRNIVDQTQGIEFKTGVVRHYNAEKGYGYIAREKTEGDLFFHASRYSPIELDRENLSILFSKVEWEKKQIKVKSNPRQDGTDEEALLDLVIPQFRTVDAVKLERVPKPGDKILYTSNFHKMRENADKWLFFQNLSELRTQLASAQQEEIEKHKSWSVYRIYRICTTKGKPYADNERKTFVTPLLKTRTCLFEGNDIDSLYRTLNTSKMQDAWGNGEVNYVCCTIIEEKEWDLGFPEPWPSVIDAQKKIEC